MSSSATKTINKKGMRNKDFERLKNMTSNISAGNVDVAAPEEQDVTAKFSGSKEFVKQSKNKFLNDYKSEFTDSSQIKSLLDLFTKRKETIKNRTARPGRSQVL